MNHSRRRFLRFAAAAALPALPALPCPAYAQAWPTRPIRWVVPYPAGGATDLISRLLAQWLTERLGQSVIVDNRPGGGTTIGTQAVVSAPPDGYTLLFTASTHTINVSLQPLPFNFLRDITLVSGFSELPLVMDVSLQASGEDARRIRRLRQGQSGQGQHRLVRRGHHQPSGDRTVQGDDRRQRRARAVSRRRADDDGPHLGPDPGRGRTRCRRRCRTSGAARSARWRSFRPSGRRSLPDVPVASEIIPEFEVRTFSGVGVPSGTPREIIERLNREINAGLADPARSRRALPRSGGMPVIMSSAEANAFVRAQTEKWAKLIKSAGIKAE